MGVFRAVSDPSARSRPSAAGRGKELVASIACQGCGRRPSDFVINSYSAGAVRRTCLCRPCHDLAEARRQRLRRMKASLGIR